VAEPGTVPPHAEGLVTRVERARGLLAEAGLDALVVTRPENIRYLSGFTGSSGALLLEGDRLSLATDGRYAEQAARETTGCRIEIGSGPPALIAVGLAGEIRLGFEPGAVTYALWQRMAAVARRGLRLVPGDGLVERLRRCKEPAELALIRRAAAIASESFEAIRPLVAPGVLERDLALEIELRMKRAGAEATAFDLIVASGPRAALPHGRASEKPLGPGEFIVFDIGARYKGYHSDLTRTLHTGAPDARARRIYETVRSAQEAAIAATAAGALAGDVDGAARDAIGSAGFGDRFGHGTGHGVGLEVHEAPRLGPRSNEVLEEGMVVTIEPGIYLPADTGVRIEDMVIVRAGGCEPITTLAKDTWSLE